MTLEESLDALAVSIAKLDASINKPPIPTVHPIPTANPVTPGQSTPASAGSGLGQWAGNYVQRMGSQLGGYAKNKISEWGGGELMNMAGAAGRSIFGGGAGGASGAAGGAGGAGGTGAAGGAGGAGGIGAAGRAATGAGGAGGTGAAGGAGGAGGIGAAGRAATGGAGGAAGAAGGAGAAGMAGRVAMALGPAGIAVAAVVACVSALNQFREKLVESAKAQQAVNFQYASYSAAMANVQLQSEIDTHFRNRAVGDDTAATAKYLSQQNTKYDDQVAEFEKLWNNIKNIGLGAAMEALTLVLEPIVPVITDLNDNLKSLLGIESEPEDNDAADWLDKTAAKVAEGRRKGNDFFNRRF